MKKLLFSFALIAFLAGCNQSELQEDLQDVTAQKTESTIDNPTTATDGAVEERMDNCNCPFKIRLIAGDPATLQLCASFVSGGGSCAYTISPTCGSVIGNALVVNLDSTKPEYEFCPPNPAAFAIKNIGSANVTLTLLNNGAPIANGTNLVLAPNQSTRVRTFANCAGGNACL